MHENNFRCLFNWVGLFLHEGNHFYCLLCKHPPFTSVLDTPTNSYLLYNMLHWYFKHKGVGAETIVFTVANKCCMYVSHSMAAYVTWNTHAMLLQVLWQQVKGIPLPLMCQMSSAVSLVQLHHISLEIVLQLYNTSALHSCVVFKSILSMQ